MFNKPTSGTSWSIWKQMGMKHVTMHGKQKILINTYNPKNLCLQHLAKHFICLITLMHLNLWLIAQNYVALPVPQTAAKVPKSEAPNTIKGGGGDNIICLAPKNNITQNLGPNSIAINTLTLTIILNLINSNSSKLSIH